MWMAGLISALKFLGLDLLHEGSGCLHGSKVRHRTLFRSDKSLEELAADKCLTARNRSNYDHATFLISRSLLAFSMCAPKSLYAISQFLNRSNPRANRPNKYAPKLTKPQRGSTGTISRWILKGNNTGIRDELVCALSRLAAFLEESNCVGSTMMGSSRSR